MSTNDFNIPPEGINLYVRRRGCDLEKLKAALQSKETDDFFRIGHGIKGNAVNFGFPELEIIGGHLESIAQSDDWDFAQQTIKEMESWYLRESKFQRTSPIEDS